MQIVKIYRYLLFCLVIMFCQMLRAAQTAVTRGSSISLEISMPTTTVTFGSAIDVKTTLTNVSTHNVEYVITTASPLFETYVYDLTGNVAPETDLGRRRHGWLPKHQLKSGAIVSASQVLAPQKSIELLQDLSKEYDLQRPGRYKVRVEVQDPEQRNKKIGSNTVVFTLITP